VLRHRAPPPRAHGGVGRPHVRATAACLGRVEQVAALASRPDGPWRTVGSGAVRGSAEGEARHGTGNGHGSRGRAATDGGAARAGDDALAGGGRAARYGGLRGNRWRLDGGPGADRVPGGPGAEQRVRRPGGALRLGHRLPRLARADRGADRQPLRAVRAHEPGPAVVLRGPGAARPRRGDPADTRRRRLRRRRRDPARGGHPHARAARAGRPPRLPRRHLPPAAAGHPRPARLDRGPGRRRRGERRGRVPRAPGR
jgi:hypothetical protein